MARRGSRSRGEKVIDNVRWRGFSGGTEGTALAAGTFADQMVTASTAPETIMRTRGEVCVWIDNSEAPPVELILSIGLILVPEGTGATVLWAPFTDDNAPWFWFDSFTIGYEEYVTDVIAAQEMHAVRRVIDSKAMRRMPSDVEIQLVMENTTISGAGSVNVGVTGRFLLGS